MSPRLEAILAGVVLAIVVVGLTLGIVIRPWLTASLVDRVGSRELTGLTPSQTRLLAEEVRAYVTIPRAPALPETAFGRPAFDAAQVSHLDDVRDVMLAARLATLAAIALSAVWVAWCVARRRGRVLASACRVAGGLAIGFVLLAAAAGFLDFDVLFERFHGLFFAAGTWTFAWEDLVIQLFPQAFWVAAAAIWGGLILLFGALLIAGSWLVGRSGARPAFEDE